MRIVVMVAAIAAAALIGGGCGDDDEGSPTTVAEEASDEATEGEESAQESDAEPASDEDGGGSTKPTGTKIGVADSQFGEILFGGGNGERAIYLFDRESSAESECYGECADAWPPVLTDGEPRAAGAVKQGLLGTTERDDGSTQVTYDSQPLYYYVDDPAGQALCHNVDEFGGLWLVLRADGNAVS
jgi:predicted lipoprotein with Yx(FWY)xxD motif